MSGFRRFRIAALASVLAALLAVAIAAPAQPANSAPGYLPLSSINAAGINDLVLIYQGGAHRPDWTPDQFAPYISFRDAESGKEVWLFDGFLFIEFKDDRGYEYAQGYKQKAARQQDWLWLLERNFEQGHAIDALDQGIASAAKRIGQAQRRRQVVLTLPEPIHGQTDWGELDGRAMDFKKPDDRVAACAWHVKTALAKWRSLAPKHLDLAGFYWVAEHSSHGEAILPRIAGDIHAHGKRFFWIPYWNARGAADWRALGFDAGYQQPNHFFHPEISDSRLDAACVFARTHGMGLEFECDGRAIKSADVFRPRLHAYLRAFARNGAKKDAAMAYYEGGAALLQMANASAPEVRALYEEVARWVAARQKLADARQCVAK